MLLAILALFAVSQVPTGVELPVIKAGLGTCQADFTVKDMAGAPIYNATITVRVRYGFMSMKRMDLEIGTNSEGKARVEGLPEKAKALNYEIARDATKKIVTQDVQTVCKGTYDVIL